MSKIKIAVFVLAFLVSFNCIAHSPSSVKAKYDAEKGELKVIAEHNVADPGKHYIDKIEVFKGGKKIVEKTYTKQTDNKKHEVMSIKINAKKGDKLKIVAKCNVAGSGTTELEIK